MESILRQTGLIFDIRALWRL